MGVGGHAGRAYHRGPSRPACHRRARPTRSWVSSS